MFGYVAPENAHLYMKDDVLYKALYCGICKSIGGTCGQVSRLSLTYDVAFLSAIAHNIVGRDVTVKKSHCVIHPVTKRPIAARDELSDALADVNVILAYHKLLDDVYDENKGKLRSLILKGGYKRAKKRHPEIDEIVKTNYEKLFGLEKSNCAVLDRVCDAFAVMLKDISASILKEYRTEYTDKLFYNVGKWIYLIDALDDYDKDIKKNDYNVLRLSYSAESAAILLKDHSEDMFFTFDVIFREIADCLKNVKFHFNTDLIANILLRGLPAKTDEVIGRIDKCSKNSIK